jgi:hypothetical protein
MAAVIVVITPVAVVMILVVPMALVQLPAFPIVVVMWMVPIRALIWRTRPSPRNPAIAMTVWSPVPFDPHETWAWNRPASLIAESWRRRPDVNRNLSERRNR